MSDKLASTCAYHTGLEEQIKAICHKMDEREKQTNLQFNGIHREVALAKAEMDRRLNDMNEFREQLSQQAASFIPRGEMKLEVEKLIQRILPLERGLNFREGSRHWSDYIVITAVGAIVFFLLHYVLKF